MTGVGGGLDHLYSRSWVLQSKLCSYLSKFWRPTMRFLIIALALAAFTGSQASSPKSESDHRLEKWIIEWESQMKKIIDQIEDELTLLQKSEFSLELGELLSTLVSNATELWSEHDWPEDIRRTSHLFFGVPCGIFKKAANSLLNIGFSREFLTSVDAAFDVLALYVDPILDPITPQAKTLLDDLTAKAEGQLPTLQNTRRNLQSLGDRLVPYLKELKEYGGSAQPAVLQAEEKLILVLEAFHKHVLGPYVSPILEATEKYALDFERWVSGRDPPPQSQKQ